MIPRYTPPEFASLWSQQRKYETWFDVEIAACAAMEKVKVVPEGVAQRLRPVRAQLNAERIDEIEKRTRHDVIAFLTHVEELGGAEARWLHRGMTSSDVLDTSLALLMVEAAAGIRSRLVKLLYAFRDRAEEHRTTPAMGRSHGIHAEPVTFGVVLAGHMAELTRSLKRLDAARKEIAVGKIAGAVGTYAHVMPEVEATTLSQLGLQPETVATQVVARDRHANYLNALALVAAGIERFATNVRHWQRTEVQEAEEAFGKGQKGSSAMPHKRNPILSENLCGLARVVRAAAMPGLENVALWHERDISHSSVERMLIPDATATLAFMLSRTCGLVEGLRIRKEGLARNLDTSKSLWASEGILLALVDKGVARQEGYVWVQRNAMKAFEGEGGFADLVSRDEDISRVLDGSAIARCFDLNHTFQHCDRIIDRAIAELPIDGKSTVRLRGLGAGA